MSGAPPHLPPTRTIRQPDTHRLIPSVSVNGDESVLARIADDDTHLQALVDLDHATNDRLLAEHGLLPGIGIHELVFGTPHCRVINATFTHAHPFGSRFNGPDRGAWYAGFALETAQAEVAFHKSVQLAEIARLHDDVTYDDYLADFGGELHDLRGQPAFASCLSPTSYQASQDLAAQLLDVGATGVVYPSVRHPGGTCIACFRPALVGNVRRGRTYRFQWHGTAHPTITLSRKR